MVPSNFLTGKPSFSPVNGGQMHTLEQSVSMSKNSEER